MQKAPRYCSKTEIKTKKKAIDYLWQGTGLTQETVEAHMV
jgi:hypothetical protein